MITQIHAEALDGLARLEQSLRQRFLRMDEQIRALVLAVAAGEPLLLIGPPGTAKSRLIRAFCEAIGLIDEAGASADGYFEYLLTPFTEPAELFGYYDVAALSQGRLVRPSSGMMQHARAVFLDEVFNASSAILNSILAFMNERTFHDRGQRTPVRMECMFAATNEVPKAGELRAVFDRFVLRSWVDNVEARPGPLRDLVARGWLDSYTDHPSEQGLGGLLEKMQALRIAVRSLGDTEIVRGATDDGLRELFGNLAHLTEFARSQGLGVMSNRRLVKLFFVMVINRVYRARLEKTPVGPRPLGEPELELFWKYFVDRQDRYALDRIKLPYPMS